MRSIFTFLLFFILFNTQGQNISYPGSKFELTGNPGSMVTPQLNVKNTGTNTIEVVVRRINQNLPQNWTSCFCYLICNPPAIDTLRFTLTPGETAGIGIGFNSDTIPGIGYVKVTVEQTGGSQKDTLEFSGSTMTSGIKEFAPVKSLSFYPNPTTGNLTAYSPINNYSITVFDLQGKSVKTFTELPQGKNEFNIKELSCGEYLLRVSIPSGRYEWHKIIRE